jgi:hypothetical protein
MRTNLVQLLSHRNVATPYARPSLADQFGFASVHGGETERVCNDKSGGFFFASDCRARSRLASQANRLKEPKVGKRNLGHSARMDALVCAS